MLKMFHGLRPGRGSSYFIACSDAPAMHKLMADLVLTGTNDHTTINAFLLAKGAGDFLFSTGTIFTAGTISTQANSQKLRGPIKTSVSIFATNSAGSDAPILLLAHGSCAAEDFQIHGNSANNVGRTSMVGLKITANTCNARRVYVFSSAGRGVEVSGAIQEVILEYVVSQNSVTLGFLISATAGLGCTLSMCASYGAGSVGCQVSGTGHKISNCLWYASTTHGLTDTGSFTQIDNCEFQGNGQFGCSLGGGGASLTGGVARSNGWGVIITSGSTATRVTGIVSHTNSTGIQHDTGAGPAVISGCMVYNNGGYGIYGNADYLAVVGNYVALNSTAGNLTWDQLYLDASADNCFIAGNKFWRGAAGNRGAVGIRLSTGSNNYVAANDLFEGGITAEISDSGTNTRRPVKRQLDYTASSDLLSGAVWAANTWTDIVGNQTFRVDSATSVIEIAVRGSMMLGASGTANAETGSRINVDSGGTPILRLIGGDNMETTAGFAHPLAGSGSVFLTGLAIGNHTVKVQAIASVISNAYCRAAGVPNTEHLAIQVVEHLSV